MIPSHARGLIPGSFQHKPMFKIGTPTIGETTILHYRAVESGNLELVKACHNSIFRMSLLYICAAEKRHEEIVNWYLTRDSEFLRYRNVIRELAVTVREDFQISEKLATLKFSVQCVDSEEARQVGQETCLLYLDPKYHVEITSRPKSARSVV